MTELFSPGDVIVLPSATETPGHKPAGYMLVAVCSCGKNHPASAEPSRFDPSTKDAE